MLKAVILGTLCGIAVIVTGVLLGLTVVPDDPQISFAQRHNRLIQEWLREWHIQALIVLGWILVATLGGYVAAPRHREKWTFASISVGIALVIVWGLPSLLIAGAGALTHMLAVGAMAFLFLPLWQLLLVIAVVIGVLVTRARSSERGDPEWNLALYRNLAKDGIALGLPMETIRFQLQSRGLPPHLSERVIEDVLRSKVPTSKGD